MQYEAGLNQRVALGARMRAALDGAHKLHLDAASDGLRLPNSLPLAAEPLSAEWDL